MEVNVKTAFGWCKGLVLLTLMTIIALPAAAHVGEPPWGYSICRRPAAIADYLGLSEEQRADWRLLREAFRAEVAPLRDLYEPLREELEALLEAETPEPCAVGEVLVEIDSVRDDIDALRDQYELDFEALLTAEQLVLWQGLEPICFAEDLDVGIPE